VVQQQRRIRQLEMALEAMAPVPGLDPRKLLGVMQGSEVVDQVSEMFRCVPVYIQTDVTRTAVVHVYGVNRSLTSWSGFVA
jgi:hypothetical protein